MMRRGWAAALVVGVLVVMAAGWLLHQERRAPRPETGDAFSVTGVLSGEEEARGYARVTGPEPLEFPRDHGPHPGYRHEWWYVTGNLTGPDDRHFGYQITFFRFNVDPAAPERESVLATNQVWMAHLAVTDGDGGTFHHAERLSRGAAGLAGARAEPFRVWLDDWTLEADRDDRYMPLRLRAGHDRFSLDLVLDAVKPPVLQGDRGYSRKGSDPGNASRYFSFTRLSTEGVLRLDGMDMEVQGSSWMDREWGTSTLEEGQTGWDWFSIQLDDDRDIMFYHLRREDGTVDPRSKGVLVEADGASRLLSLDDVEIESTRYWDSPLGDVSYPVAWRMRLPAEGLELELSARVDDQELRTGFRYWEGAIRVRGTADGGPVEGVGYAELTGY